VGVVGRAQVGEAGLRHDERAAAVDVQHEVVALDRQVGDRHERDRARVVHAQVDAAEAVHRLRHRRRHLVLEADVADDGQGLAAGRLDLRRRGVDRAGELGVRLVGLGHQRDVAAVGGNALGDLEADAAARARDEHGASGERVHPGHDRCGRAR